MKNARHKTNWDRVKALLEKLPHNSNAANELRDELLPFVTARLSYRERKREYMVAYRDNYTDAQKERRRKYARDYYWANRDKCNKASTLSRRRRKGKAE